MLLQGPLKEVLGAVTRRCPRKQCFIGDGQGAPHMAFLGPRNTEEGPKEAFQGPPRKRRLASRDFSALIKETERDYTPSPAAEGILGFRV